MVPRWLALVALLAGFALPARAQPLAPSGPTEEILSPPQLAPPAPPPQPNAIPPPVDLRPFQPPPGWFVSAEAFLAAPQIRSIDSCGCPYFNPVPNLDLTVIPALTLGYRFEDGNAFLATYRYLGTGGNNSCMCSNAHARLDAHWLDLDYRGDVHGPWRSFTFQWQTGIRLSVVDFHTGADSAYQWSREDDNFVGAGPHFGIDLNWYAGRSGVGVFTRGDVGLLLGQGYERTGYEQKPYTDAYLTYAPITAGDSAIGTKVQFNVLASAGLSYTPHTQRWLRFEGGVQLLDFIELGRNFANAGPFVRCEIGF